MAAYKLPKSLLSDLIRRLEYSNALNMDKIEQYCFEIVKSWTGDLLSHDHFNQLIQVNLYDNLSCHLEVLKDLYKITEQSSNQSNFQKLIEDIQHSCCPIILNTQSPSQSSKSLVQLDIPQALTSCIGNYHTSLDVVVGFQNLRAPAKFIRERLNSSIQILSTVDELIDEHGQSQTYDLSDSYPLNVSLIKLAICNRVNFMVRKFYVNNTHPIYSVLLYANVMSSQVLDFLDGIHAAFLPIINVEKSFKFAQAQSYIMTSSWELPLIRARRHQLIQRSAFSQKTYDIKLKKLLIEQDQVSHPDLNTVQEESKELSKERNNHGPLSADYYGFGLYISGQQVVLGVQNDEIEGNNAMEFDGKYQLWQNEVRVIQRAYGMAQTAVEIPSTSEEDTTDFSIGKQLTPKSKLDNVVKRRRVGSQTDLTSASGFDSSIGPQSPVQPIRGQENETIPEQKQLESEPMEIDEAKDQNQLQSHNA